MTDELTGADWERINARGAESAARQRQARDAATNKNLLGSLEHAPAGEYRKVFQDGRLIGYAPVIEQPIGKLTPSGFRNGTVA
jgi:hypothetical protein